MQKVMGLVGNAEEKEWVQLGMLDTAFTEIYLPFWDNLFEVKFEWEEKSCSTKFQKSFY